MTTPTKLDELIAGIPPAYQQIARDYAPLLLEMGQDAITAWTGSIMAGQWSEAYRAIVRRMPTDAVIAAQDAVNVRLRAMNRRNASYLEVQRQIVQDAITTGLLLFRQTM